MPRPSPSRFWPFSLSAILAFAAPAFAASPAPAFVPAKPAAAASPAKPSPAAQLPKEAPADPNFHAPPVPTTGAGAPVVIRIGTSALWTIREGQGTVTVAERSAVVQSRIDQVLLHHPYLPWVDVKLLKESGAPTIYWGPFPIMQVDMAHARLNNFSSPDLLAHAWANSMRAGIKTFFAGKHMPNRALYHSEKGNDYTYRRTDHTLNQPNLLRNTRYIFSPEDFQYGAGAKDAGQNGFVVFVKKDAATPPTEIYLGNPQGQFQEYDFIRPEETP
jgi:hypothetical protein